MNNQPYALLSSWGRPNMQNREWLAQTEDDKEDILTNESVVAGDKVYVIESKARYVLGLDLAWHNVKAGGGGPLEDIEVEYTANDTYTIEPSTGYYGIGSAEITVNVEPTLEDVTASYSANDTYTLAPSSGYDGIGSAEITVNVEPTLEALETVYLENGEYTIRPTAGIDGISEVAVTVNVSGGGEESSEPTVFLYDYDGAVIASYTPTQFAALSAYPAAPVHSGLTFQEYNWPLATAKEYVANYGRCDIGATYRTADNKTKAYLYVKSTSLNISVYFAINGTGEISWGDGSTTTIQGDSLETAAEESHAYANPGDYLVEFTYNGILQLGDGNNPLIWQGISGTDLKKLELGINTILGDGAFYIGESESVLETIVIPKSEYLTSIPAGAFEFCNMLRYITVPYGVGEISFNAFCYCSNLSAISMPPTCETIEQEAFNSTDLTSIVLPPLLTTLNHFSSLTSLEEIIIPNSVTYIDSYAFNDTLLRTIKFPSSITHFGDNLFPSTGTMRNVVLSEGLNDIPNLQSVDIKSIVIPSSVSSIADYTFSQTSLNDINLPNTINYMNSYIFDNCTNLISANVCCNLNGGYTFSYCTALRNVTFSEDVNYIGAYTFSGCGALCTITFEGIIPPELGDETALTDIPTGCVIRVPQGSLSAYTSAENYPDPSTYTYVEYAAE